MKTTLLIVAGSLLAASLTFATTNDTASVLQKGLFEEEANQNLNAAIQAYQTVANQFEKDRKLAATATFRLGECYRKQGSTNEAVAQYEKVLRDFSDQPQLVTLSRQGLKSLGSALIAPAEAMPDSSERAQLATLDGQLEAMKQLPKDQLRIAIQQNFPNPVLTSLMQKLAEAEQNLATAQKEFGPQHAEVIKATTVLDTINKQIDAQVDVAVRSLAIKRDTLKSAVVALPSNSSARPASSNDNESAGTITASEADEIKRIQAMIKESPDLINARNPVDGSTPLHQASSSGRLVVAKFLLANGADIEARDNADNTPLHDAARAGHKAIVELLLDNKADIRAFQGDRVTPLHLAAAHGFRSVAELLLLRGADVNAKTGSGATPLHEAAVNGFRSVAELLLAHGADINAVTSDVAPVPATTRYNGSSLVLAVARDDQPMVELLLSNKADVTVTDRQGRAPLHVAAIGGYIPVAASLLAHGAEVNILGVGSDVHNWTPLACAVNANQKDMVAYLLKNKADSEARIGTTFGEGGQNYTPLLLATARVEPQIVDLLLEANADPNQGNQTRFPILNAMNNENSAARKQMAKSLVAHGAHLDVQDSDGNTPLMLAARRGDEETVAALLAGHPDLNAQDKRGLTALHHGVVGSGPGAAGVEKLLLAADANPNLPDAIGDTPLHFAASLNKADLVELLLANHADPNLPDARGQTPLDQFKNSPGALQPAFGGVVPMRRTPGAVSSTAAPQPNVAELLHQHGALDELPSTNRISVSRPAINYSATLFTKNDMNWNQFRLFDLLAVEYGMLIPSVMGSPSFGAANKLNFPDFSHIRIRRLTPDHKGWQDSVVDISAALDSGDCSANAPLQWGDIVEIPESDHVLDEYWRGLSSEDFGTLKKCLSRQIEISVKDQTNKITLAPSQSPGVLSDFHILPVLNSSRMLLASSDLSRIKVTRRNATTGQTNEWIVNGSDPYHQPDLWLQDGDKITVPEKPMFSGSRPPRRTAITPPSPDVQIASGVEQLNLVRIQPDAVFAPATAEFVVAPGAVPSAPLNYQWNFNGAQQVEDPEPAKPHQILRAASMPVSPRQPSQSPDQRYAMADGVLFSPSPDDRTLLDSGYVRASGVKNHLGQSWEQRATADIPGRGGASAIWTGKEMILFGGEGPGVSYDDGARYNFAEDSWQTLPMENAPSSRTGATAVWTGKEMIVWGGFGGKFGNDTNRNDGARYNPEKNSWTLVSTENAPKARFDHKAVWTGKEMIVWGGYTDSHARYGGSFAPAHLKSGGRYNPAKNSWTDVTTKGAPSARVGDAAAWTGKEMIIWGGADTKEVLGDGMRYNPAKDAWKPVSAKGAPCARMNPMSVWTGKEMIVWGGNSRDVGSACVYYQDGARYNPDTDTWTPMSRVGAPKERTMAVAVWTGKEMILWGGVNDADARGVSDSSRFLGTGALYDPASDKWTPITKIGAPSARVSTAVAANDGMLLFGGYNGLHLNDTYFFSPNQTLYPYARK